MQGGIGGVAIIIALLVLVWWYNQKRHGLVPPDAPVPEGIETGGQ